MKASEKSVAEYEIEEILKKACIKLSETPLNMKDANEIINTGSKILSKCEMLRKSRDNWRNKFEKLMQEKNGN